METATAPKKSSTILPSNAYTPLEPGEQYKPIVPPGDRRAEVTVWSVTLGLVMVAVFSAACIYMALRTGNAIEAAIPIAIMAIFFGRRGLKPGGKSTILENVIVQSIGQAAGVVAAGAAFLIPASTSTSSTALVAHFPGLLRSAGFWESCSSSPCASIS